jgi:hypothetical protein
MEESRNILYSQEVLEFSKCAQTFCRWIEYPEMEEIKSFVKYGLEILPQLYSRMIAIPDIEPAFDQGVEKFVTEEEWSVVYKKLAERLGSFNDYNDIPDKTEYDRSEIISRQISEDISDIYQDIRDFIEVFQNSPEDIMNDALWECKTLFENNWGKKVLRALRAMHNIYLADDISTTGQTGQEKDLHRKIDTRDWFITKRQQQFGEEDDIIPE